MMFLLKPPHFLHCFSISEKNIRINKYFSSFKIINEQNDHLFSMQNMYNKIIKYV